MVWCVHDDVFVADEGFEELANALKTNSKSGTWASLLYKGTYGKCLRMMYIEKSGPQHKCGGTTPDGSAFAN